MTLFVQKRKGEPMSDDLISRQAVLEKAYPYGNGLEPDGYCVDVEDIQAVPAIAPKTGHWIPLDKRFTWSDYFKCSECGFRINLRTAKDFGILSVDYCPHCGAKMEVNGNE
jgi:DNA-directed RNA polymerase subunit RPC12/RpoP